MFKDTELQNELGMELLKMALIISLFSFWFQHTFPQLLMLLQSFYQTVTHLSPRFKHACLSVECAWLLWYHSFCPTKTRWSSLWTVPTKTDGVCFEQFHTCEVLSWKMSWINWISSHLCDCCPKWLLPWHNLWQFFFHVPVYNFRSRSLVGYLTLTAVSQNASISLCSKWQWQQLCTAIALYDKSVKTAGSSCFFFPCTYLFLWLPSYNHVVCKSELSLSTKLQIMMFHEVSSHPSGSDQKDHLSFQSLIARRWDLADWHI